MQRQSLSTSPQGPLPSQSPSNGYVGKPAPHPILLLSVTFCGMEYLLDHSLWVSYPGCVPDQPLAHSLAGRKRNREGLNAVLALLSNSESPCALS